MTVTPGQNPPSTGLAVTADLTSIGGSATQAFAPNGNTFTFNASVPGATSPGSKSFPVTIADGQGRHGSASIALTVTTPLAPTSPSGVGAANPSSQLAGGSTVLTVTVTPGTNPTSSGIGVTADLSSIGGSAVQPFVDGGNNVFSFSTTISARTTGGAKTLPFTISDAQSRLGSGSIGVTVVVPTPPSGAGSAVPANVPAGGATTLTVNVTPGTNPPSTASPSPVT